MQSSRMVREGSVGLLALLGLVLFGGLVIWLRGTEFGKKSYHIIAEFEDVGGIRLGSIVRYRGVEVGKIKGIQPQTNGVDVILEIASAKLVIPRQVKIQTSTYGLIGETIVDIVPLQSLPPEAKSLSPLSSECNSQVIICNGDRLEGTSGNELIASLTHLSQVYSSPEFYNNINSAIANSSLAAAKIAKLSDEMSALTRTVRQDLEGFSVTIEAITKATNTTTEQIVLLGNEYRTVAQRISQLASNTDAVLRENRTELNKTLTSIGDTSNQLRGLAVRLDTTIASADTEKLIQDIETLLDNATAASDNLRNVSATLNEPANLLVLQQTLDSARATFENAQKITSDLDDLTGDPAFRNDVRKLIKGLSSLISFTQQLERQMQTAQTWEPINQQLKWQVQTLQAWEPANLQLGKTDKEKSAASSQQPEIVQSQPATVNTQQSTTQ